MREVKSKKRYLAGVLVVIMALGLAGFQFSDLYAANQIDISKACSLILQVPDNSEYGKELSEVSLKANLYRIASVDKDGTYTSTTEFQSLEIEKSELNQEKWEEIAEEAAGLAEGETADTQITIENGTGKAENLQTGMYLVMVENVITDLHEYSFNPCLIALPDNLYYQTGKVENDVWQYDAVCHLKPEQNPRYGSLKICKTLTSYNTSLGDVTFVFQVEGVDEEGNTVYSNVVSTTHGEAGTKEVVIEHIPAGTTVTVTEVYSGASYRLETEPEKTAVIAADEFVTVDFSNTYDDELTPGYGVTNHFEYSEDEGWQWSTLRDNSVSNE
ncbi:MAG: DUF5979 domain-containing protein [Roseburia sp.]